MQQSGNINSATPFSITGQTMSFPGQNVLDQAIVTLQELSAGNVQFLNSISSALLKWATVFQRVASDVRVFVIERKCAIYAYCYRSFEWISTNMP
jgi:hypothetical protein